MAETNGVLPNRTSVVQPVLDNGVIQSFIKRQPSKGLLEPLHRVPRCKIPPSISTPVTGIAFYFLAFFVLEPAAISSLLNQSMK